MDRAGNKRFSGNRYGAGPARLPGIKAEALHLADRTSEALEAINEAEALAERFEQRCAFSELHRLRGVFLTALGAEETQIEASFCAAIRIAREQKSISTRNAQKQPTQNTAAKKRPDQEDVDSDYLFGDCSQRAVSRFGCGKSSVIKQTLEMQSEDTSATRDPLKEACLARGVWVNS